MSPAPVFGQLYDAIRQAKRILVVGDGRPDGDSMGSSSAVLTWLIGLGKDVQAFCVVPVKEAFAFLDNAYRYTSDPATFDQPWDLVLIFDAGDLKHGGIVDLLPRIPGGYRLGNIDHHSTNQHYGHINVVFPEASSTCEVVYRFFEECGIAMDDRMATSLLTGILTDTGTFTNSGTTVKSLEAAAELVRRGGRYGQILRAEFRNQPVEAMRLRGKVLSRLQYDPKRDLAVTYLLRSDLEGVKEEYLNGLSNFLNAVCGFADTVLVLRETTDGKVKGSMRSIKRDISGVAKLLGGGGHKKAAAFAVDGTLNVENGKVTVVRAG